MINSSKIRTVTISLALTLLLVYLFFIAQTTLTTQQLIVGQAPQKLDQQLASNNKTHIVYLYFASECKICEQGHLNFFARHLRAWTANVSDANVNAKALNYAKLPKEGKEIFEAFSLSGERVGESLVAVYNREEGFTFPPTVGDAAINSAVRYLVYGVPVSTERETIVTSKPFMFFIGLVAGINPCLMALTSFLFMYTTQTKVAYRVRRIFIVVSGILYVQLALTFMFFSFPGSVVYISQVTPLIISALVILGTLYLIEAGYDFYMVRRTGGPQKSKLPLFSTPRRLKVVIGKATLRDNPYFDFALGALFGLVKLPCLAATYLFVFLSSPGELILNTIIFHSGAIFPIVLIVALIAIGLLKTSRLDAIRFKGRTLQRTVVGFILILGGFFYWLGSL